MIKEFIQAFLLVFLAEMGDKSQLLAITFATRYPLKKVLIGMLAGALLNDGLAVMLGRLVSGFVPMKTIQMIAGFAFLLFAFWSLRVEEGGEAESGSQKFQLGPVLTVATAYFIGEFGDKTQLTAIALASDADAPLAILAGTVSGMIGAGGIGIFIGKKLGDKIPEMALKLASTAIFLFFGISKLAESIPKGYWTDRNILSFGIVLTIALVGSIRKLMRAQKQGRESALIRKSRELYDYYHQIGRDFDRICLGTRKCGKCQGDHCIVGSTKTLIQSCLDGKPAEHPSGISKNTLRKPFNREQAMRSLRMTWEVLKEDPDNPGYQPIHKIRKNLEIILFGQSVDRVHDWNEYGKLLSQKEANISAGLSSNWKKAKNHW